MKADPYLRVAAIARNAKGNFLVVQHRAAGAQFWTCPGGLVNPGESLSYALRRSVAQEIGLQIRIGDIACIGEVTLARNERRRVEVYFWVEACGARESTPHTAWVSASDSGVQFSPAVVLDAIARGVHGAYLGNITDHYRALPAQPRGSRRARV